MNEEKRNDIGYKVTTSLCGTAFAIILGLFINVTWITANEGKNIGYEVKADLKGVKADVQAKYDAIKEDLLEIKILLKRKIPTNE